ncbi:general stress protein [Desulfovibrio inopinatus]|uniref:general stress protein n=1 Tax=Desulfovibrio inopinatus TaxID=102109 RepID=UPI000409DEFB|nr:general stress protein [Desulfovibrio inopinatus]
MEQANATVGVYGSHDLAAEAVRSLASQGFSMNKVSIVGRELEDVEDIKGYYTWKDPAKSGAGIGGFWGSLFGILVGVGFLVVPGVGGVFVAGSLAAVLLGGVEGAVLGAAGGGLFGALMGLGIGKNKVLKYQESIKAGKYIVVAHGNVDEVKKAREILNDTENQELETHT